MAQATTQLIDALRETASNLRNGSHYSWGHHGACNCGNLVQVVTQFSKGEILRYAHEGAGEWTELAQEFCPVTKAPIDLIISKLVAIGLTPTDIHHIEYLTDREVLNNLTGGFRWLQRNNREDAISYFEAFADLLQEKWLMQIDLSLDKIMVPTVNEKVREEVLA